MSQEKEVLTKYDELTAKTLILIEDDGHLAAITIDLGRRTGVLGESPQEIESNLRIFASFWLSQYNIIDSHITCSITKTDSDLLEISVSFTDSKEMEEIGEKCEMIVQDLFNWLSITTVIAILTPESSLEQRLN